MLSTDQLIVKTTAKISDAALIEAERLYKLGYTIEEIVDIIGITMQF